MSGSFQLPSYAIIGTGRLGSHLALQLSRAGFWPESLISRTGESAKKLRVLLSASVPRVIQSGTPDQFSDIAAELIIISVPDDLLAPTIKDLGESEALGECRTILHTSGALTSSVFGSLQTSNRSVGSFHPLQTFAYGVSDYEEPTLLASIPVIIEGDLKAVEMAVGLAEVINAKPVILDQDAKLLYHAAAVFSSNYLTTLFGAVESIIAEISPSQELTIQLFRPLAEQALHNTFEQGPGKALTGPVVRGDVEILKSHLAAFAERIPVLVPAYAALAGETIRLALNEGRITVDVAQAFEKVLMPYRVSGRNQ